MAKSHKPKAGSRGFWPRKRAKRIYPAMSHSGDYRKRIPSGETSPLFFAGYKAGMTHVSFEDNRKNSATFGRDVVRAVTVLDCPPIFVMGIKLYRKQGTSLRESGFFPADEMRKEHMRKTSVLKGPVPKQMDKINPSEYNDIRMVVQTQPSLSGMSKKKPEMFEISLSGSAEEMWKYAREMLGKEISPSDVFSEGEYVDVKAVTKGKGHQGVVKRFGTKIRTRKDKGKRRHIGTMGSVTPGRVLPGSVPQSGQHGFHARTEYGKRIMKISGEGFSPDGGFVGYGNVKGSYVLVEGSVPGSRKRLVFMRKAERKHSKETVEIKKVSTSSQMG